MFKWNSLCLSSCPLPLVLSLGSVFFTPSIHQMFVHMDKMPQSLLFPRLSSPSSLSLSPYDRCSKLLITFVAIQYVRVSLVLGSPALGAAPSRVSPWLGRGARSPLWTCCQRFPQEMPPRRLVATMAGVNCCPPRIPGPLRPDCFPAVLPVRQRGHPPPGTGLGASFCRTS